MSTSRPSTAPGQLGLVQAFLNTSDLQTGRDGLSDTTEMQSWLSERRLIATGTEYDQADRRRFVDVRDALQGLVAANGGGGVQRRAVTTLNEAARRVRLGVRLHPEDGYRLMAEGVGIDRPIGELLISVTTSMADGSWNRLKICGNEACQRSFYDGSRNRSGRWCSMATCGNRIKGRAYRQRHGERAPSSTRAGGPANVARAAAAS